MRTDAIRLQGKSAVPTPLTLVLESADETDSASGLQVVIEDGELRVADRSGQPMSLEAATAQLAEHGWELRGMNGGSALSPEESRSVESAPGELPERNSKRRPELQVVDTGLLGPGRSRQRLPTAPESVTVVGRSAESDFRIDHPSVSRKHCRIVCRDEVHWLEDLGATWRTRVNGLVVEAAIPLADGARIQVGEIELEYVAAPGLSEVFDVAPAEPEFDDDLFADEPEAAEIEDHVTQPIVVANSPASTFQDRLGVDANVVPRPATGRRSEWVLIAVVTVAAAIALTSFARQMFFGVVESGP